MRKYSTSKLDITEYVLFVKQLAVYSGIKICRYLKKERFLIALFLGAISMVVYASITQSIWLDEGLNIQFARESISETIERSKTTDLHPPLYYMFQHMMGKMFGTHVLLYRFLSGIFFILSGLTLYKYLKKINGSTTRNLVYVSLFLYSPFALYYASEARSFSSIILISFVQFFAFHQILEEGERKRKEKVVYALSSIVGVYTSYLFVFLLMGQFFYIIVAERKKFRNMFLVWIVIGAAYLPWLVVALFARLGENPGHFLPIPWWQIPAIIFLGFAGGRVSITDINHIHAYLPTIVIGVVYLLNFLGLLYWWKKRRKENRLYYRAYMVLLLTIILCLIVSATKFSIFDPRYYTQLFPLFILLLVISIEYLFRKNAKQARLLFASLMVGNSMILGLYLFNPWYAREPWKTVVPELESQLQDYDAVLFIGYRQPPPNYREYQKKDVEIISTEKNFDEESISYDVVRNHVKTELIDNHRVWYSQFLEWQKDPEGKIRGIIEEDFEYKKTIGFFKVKFDLYERR